jgi:asparagine synthase (glutamine-hydrolysing)
VSGICGVIRFDGSPVAEPDLDRQLRALAHLGPDQARRWCGGPAGLGALLMQVTREDLFEQQPLHDSAAGLVFVCDARIDNRDEIAAALDLDAAALHDMPDSRLLFTAYKAWGAACAERLIGDFVFAAWNAGAGTLELARDHMGQRHIFFHAGDGFFAFATEKKGLWALPDVPRVFPEASLARSLAPRQRRGLRQAGDAAAWDGIGSLPGGAILTLAADGSTTSRRYWAPRAAPEHENQSEAYYVDAYRRVLAEAVACRLRRTMRPAGVFMSGGFDSAAICALAGPVMRAQGRKLVAASSVMPEGYRGTIRHARPWVELCRREMPHIDVRYVTSEGLSVLANLERGFLSHDGPRSPNHAVNDALFSVIAAAGARVVMDGYGGDYTLNPKSRLFFVTLLKRGKFRLFVREWRARRRFLGVSQWTMVKSALIRDLAPPLVRRWRRHVNGLAPTGPTMPLTADFVSRFEDYGLNPDRVRVPTMRGALKDSLDTASSGAIIGGSITAAAHGLEFTQPFHDKRVIELALAIPEEMYIRNGRERYLARVALKDLYPPEFQDRLPGNYNLAPDFLRMAKAEEPAILAEIDRMEASGDLAKYFDFGRMRQMLTRRTPDQHASGSEFDTSQAINAFFRARYVKWFRGDNA